MSQSRAEMDRAGAAQSPVTTGNQRVPTILVLVPAKAVNRVTGGAKQMVKAQSTFPQGRSKSCIAILTVSVQHASRYQIIRCCFGYACIHYDHQQRHSWLESQEIDAGCWIIACCCGCGCLGLEPGGIARSAAQCALLGANLPHFFTLQVDTTRDLHELFLRWQHTHRPNSC